jgi:hypothetical protein
MKDGTNFLTERGPTEQKLACSIQCLEYIEKTLLYPGRETWPMASWLWKLTIDAQMLLPSVRAGFAHHMKQIQYNTRLSYCLHLLVSA